MGGVITFKSFSAVLISTHLVGMGGVITLSDCIKQMFLSSSFRCKREGDEGAIIKARSGGVPSVVKGLNFTSSNH